MPAVPECQRHHSREAGAVDPMIGFEEVRVVMHAS
jgi:hypothetical protein